MGKFMPPVYPPVRAASIAELARAFGLDPAALESTVDRFNAAVRPGQFDHTVLDDCRTEGLDPPKTHWARAIDTPPYFGYPLRPGITFTYLGVAVDDKARMLMQDGKPAANVSRGRDHGGHVLGKGYIAGTGWRSAPPSGASRAGAARPSALAQRPGRTWWRGPARLHLMLPLCRVLRRIPRARAATELTRATTSIKSPTWHNAALPVRMQYAPRRFQLNFQLSRRCAPER